MQWVGKNAFFESSNEGFKEKITACTKLKSLGLSVHLVHSCAGVLISVSDSDVLYCLLWKVRMQQKVSDLSCKQ